MKAAAPKPEEGGIGHGWLMKAKRARAAVLRRPNLGKAAALPYQNFGSIGKSARFDLHEPAVGISPPVHLEFIQHQLENPGPSAAPRRDAQTHFFQHPRSPESYNFKDHRSSPGREYEFIEFESPVDVRNVRALVNFCGGSCPGGPRGEVRIEFLNRICSGTFVMASAEGNQGRSGPGQSGFWAQIPVQEILKISKAAPQAASAAR
jgi:hypothetical protein